MRSMGGDGRAGDDGFVEQEIGENDHEGRLGRKASLNDAVLAKTACLLAWD